MRTYNLEQQLRSRWQSMKRRVNDIKGPRYEFYGGKGIEISKGWKDFENFKEDMMDSFILHSNKFGLKDTTLDRIDSTGDYKKDNCKWSTKKEQNRNRSCNTILSFNGKQKLICEWAELLGVKDRLITMRLKRGWSIDRALSTERRHYSNLGFAPSDPMQPTFVRRAQGIARNLGLSDDKQRWQLPESSRDKKMGRKVRSTKA